MDNNKSSEKSARQELLESIIEHGNKAFNPDSGPNSRAEGQKAFDDLIQR